jgi:hypothetical protein
MNPQSRIYKAVNTVLFMGIFILIFIFQILPVMSHIPGSEKLLVASGFMNFVNQKNFERAVTIGGTCLALFFILNAYAAAKQHRLGQYTGKKAEIYGLIYIGIGVLLLIFCIWMMPSAWGR